MLGGKLLTLSQLSVSLSLSQRFQCLYDFLLSHRYFQYDQIISFVRT